MDDNVTLGEVYRRHGDARKWLETLDAKFDNLDDRYVTRREFQKLDERITWIGRVAITGLLFPIIVGIVYFLLTGHSGGGG